MADRAGRTFRVFVSSTFADLKAERDALQRFVFPRLRELAQRYGCRFQAIDLRWGVRDEAALDQRTMPICLDEIARCQKTSPRPNFVILLGDRYGWRPLPWQIPAKEMDALRPNFGSSEDAALVEDWYKRDDNAIPPVYVLRPRVLPEAARTGATPEARAARELEASAWTKTERRLQEVLRAALAQVPFDAARREKFLASATEQEITRGAMAAEGAEGHVFAFARVIPELSGPLRDRTGKDLLDTFEKDGALLVDEEARGLQAELRDVRLPARLPGNVHRYEAHLLAGGDGLTTDHIGRLPDDLDECLRLDAEAEAGPGLCRDVWMRLSSVIKTEVEALQATDPLDREIASHRAFGDDRRRLFVGREAALAAVAGYLESVQRTPLAVFGASGSGKSAFLAQAAEKAGPSFPPDSVVIRFIGATPDSTNGRALLEGICDEIARLVSEPRPVAGAAFRELVGEFARLLEVAGRKGRLLIVIDALDQLSDAENARELLWLPDHLPANIKFVVSALPGESARALERKLPDTARVILEPMSAAEGGALLDAWLANAGRALQPAQRALVLEHFSTEGRPLSLKLACDYARQWPSFAAPDSLRLSPGIPGLLGDLFDRLSADSNHGFMLVSRSLAYLAAAKHGLSEDELLDVLSRDDTVFEDFIARAHHQPPEKRLPVIVWSRLYFDLESHLAERNADGASLLTFYHRQFAEAVQARFMEGPAAIERHRGLAGYFADQPLTVDKGRGAAPHLRKLSELPCQQTRGELWEDLRGTLADLDFLQAKVDAGLLDDTLADFETLERAFPRPESSFEDSRTELRSLLRAFSGAFNQEFHAFRDTPRIAAQQIYSNLYAQEAFRGPTGPVLKKFFERGTYPGNRPWLRRLNQAPRTSPSRDLLRTIGAHDGAVTAVAVSPDGAFLASGSVDGTVSVWNEGGGTQKAALSAHAGGVTSLRFLPRSPDSSLLASGGRDGFIRIWDWRAERSIAGWKAHADRVRALFALADGDRLASCGDEPVVRLWNRGDGRLLSELPGHKDRVFGVAADAAGTVIVSGGEDRTLRVWRLGRPGEPVTLRGNDSAVRTVALGPDASWAASGAEDGKLKTWDIGSGREKLSVEAHRRRISDLAVAPETGQIASAGEDGTVKVWDGRTLELQAAFRGHAGAVQALAFGPGGRWLASGGDDGTLRVWGLAGTRRKNEPSWEHESGVLGIAHDGACGFAATAGDDATVRVWDQYQGDHRTTLRGHIGPVNAVLLVNKDVLASAGADRTVKVWEVGTSKLLRTLGHQLSGAVAARPALSAAAGPAGFAGGGHTASVTCLALLSGDAIVSGGRDGTLRMWEAMSGREVRTFQGAKGLIDAVAADTDSGLVIGAGTSPDLVVWEAATGAMKAVWKGHTSGVTCLALPPRSPCLISGSLDKSVRAWSLPDGDSRVFRGHEDRVDAVAFDPQSGVVASAGHDASVRLWDLETGRALGVLAGHRAPVRALSLDVGDRFLVSGGDDGFVNVWGLDDGRRLARIGLGAPVTSVKYLLNKTIVAGLKNGGVAFFFLDGIIPCKGWLYHEFIQKSFQRQ